MVKKTKNSLGTVIGVVVGIAVIAMLILILAIIFNNIPSTSIPITISTTTSTTEQFLGDNGTTQSLSNTSISGTFSATGKNRTWLEFDGSNDFLNISDNSYITISFWYRNATTEWQHIVNTSGILYQNGTEVSTIPLYPVYFDDSDWLFGQLNSSVYLDVDIDEIRFYNSTINETIVDEIYADER